MKKAEQITISILGAGARGFRAYGERAFADSAKFKIVAVCDIDKRKADACGDAFGIPNDMRFYNEAEFFEKKRSDACFICTMDNDHVDQAIKAIQLGYHILLEKPISPKEKECRKLLSAAEGYDKIIMVCHVLRYTALVEKIKELLEEKVIGELVYIDHTEMIGYYHFAHSFVRGNWCRAEDSSPIILQKCCHDLDLLQFFAGSSAIKVSSVGSLKHFISDNKPEGAPERCSDDCSVSDCPYNAEKFYVEDWKKLPRNLQSAWPYHVPVIGVPTEEKLREAIKFGPYGKCVYSCDNDVMDNQEVRIEFVNGIRASLKMIAFTNNMARYIRFYGTKGEIVADQSKDCLMVQRFGESERTYKISELSEDISGHGGGDGRMLNSFYEAVIKGDIDNKTSLKDSIMSHIMAFSAEKSRKEDGKIIDVR